MLEDELFGSEMESAPIDEPVVAEPETEAEPAAPAPSGRISELGKVFHEVRRSVREGAGDYSLRGWDRMSGEEQQACCDHVQARLDNPSGAHTHEDDPLLVGILRGMGEIA